MVVVFVSCFFGLESFFDIGVEVVFFLGFGQEFVDCIFVDCVGYCLQVGIVGKYQMYCGWMQYFDLVEEFDFVYVGYVLVGNDDVDLVVGQ